ncbi:motility protein A [Clostridium chauvoei]|uniref:Motility protein A n=2 Tax=Clostridium chauvoei TaxID=46867 RepID=A0ABD4RFJ8_9CLOT|nr:motility protein A [Clostridium chauvoei]ATD54643.1 motility protein A [Clostridium chauvoei]ATD57675.1 motility protein A [Clostridium chauvoei]MBX7279936.1 motility protein A [Clostridium chauvoei]MBX7282405.1 motility protein A [Clostridium chauvoei]MBX7284827.1 motility protein A [Clostridium chauvoei]
MKKSDALTFLGLVVGGALLVYGMMSGSNLMIFWDFPSVLITIGGSFSAVLITYSIKEVKNLGKLFGQTFKETKISSQDTILQFTNLSKKARREGLLSLEDDISELEDDFLKKGLQMVVDGIEPETIREILELEIDEMESRHMKGSSIYSTWGVYAPAFGMIGTLIGLIQMLQNLTDVSNIASGMGKALITTFYGSILANLFCTPMAANLKIKSEQESQMREMMLEGILSIQSGVNPRIVEEKLLTYLNPKERLEYLSGVVENNEGVVN